MLCKWLSVAPISLWVPRDPTIFFSFFFYSDSDKIIRRSLSPRHAREHVHQKLLFLFSRALCFIRSLARSLARGIRFSIIQHTAVPLLSLKTRFYNLIIIYDPFTREDADYNFYVWSIPIFFLSFFVSSLLPEAQIATHLARKFDSTRLCFVMVMVVMRFAF